VTPLLVYRGGDNGGVAYEQMSVAPPEPILNERLMQAGYAYDHVNGAALLASRAPARDQVARRDLRGPADQQPGGDAERWWSRWRSWLAPERRCVHRPPLCARSASRTTPPGAATSVH